MTFEKGGTTKCFVSKWLPGDYLVGSGGPPIIITKEEVEDKGGEQRGMISHDIAGHSSSPNIDVETSKSTMRQPVLKYKRVAMISEDFTDNPMYPITVAKPTRMHITLYQQDKRWNISRLGEDLRDVNVASFIFRKERLQSVMKYSLGIGFLMMRLNGLKLRLTEFRLKKIAYVSDFVAFSNCVTAVVDVFPGRYAIIPYTHMPLDRITEYTLHCQYFSNHVDFEIEDAIAQRLHDKDGSLCGDDDNDEPDDNDLLRPHEHDDDVSILSYEKVKQMGNVDDDLDVDEEDRQKNVSGQQHVVALPKLMKYSSWEYTEAMEELGLQCMYREVDDMMTYLKTLKREVDRLNSSLREVTNTHS